MLVAARPTRGIRWGLVGVVAALVALLALVVSPASAAEGHRQLSVDASSASSPTVDRHLVVRAAVPVVVKRFAGDEHSVVAAAAPVRVAPDQESPEGPETLTAAAGRSTAAAARAPPVSGTSRS